MKKFLFKQYIAIALFIYCISSLNYCVAQSCNLAIITIGTGTPRNLEFTNNDTILEVINDQGFISCFYKSTLQQKYDLSRFYEEAANSQMLIKKGNKLLKSEVGGIKLLDQKGKVIYKKGHIESQIYSCDFNDTFIVLNIGNSIQLINYRSKKVREIKYSSKNIWFIKLFQNKIIYTDSDNVLFEYDIYNGGTTPINKIQGSCELELIEISKNEFYIYNNNHTYCYLDNRLKESFASIDTNYIKLLVTMNEEYYYDSLRGAVIIRQIKTGEQQVFKIAQIYKNTSYYNRQDLGNSVFKISNSLLPYSSNWIISHDQNYLAGYWFNSGEFLVLNLLRAMDK